MAAPASLQLRLAALTRPAKLPYGHAAHVMYLPALLLALSLLVALGALAGCGRDQRCIDAAVARWQTALQRDPLSPDALAGLGTTLYRLGQRDAGLELYGRAVAVDPGYVDEAYLRAERLWGAPALLDSRALRAALAP